MKCFQVCSPFFPGMSQFLAALCILCLHSSSSLPPSVYGLLSACWKQLLWQWWLFTLAHLPVFLCAYPPNVQCLWWFIGVSVNCCIRSCIKWPAFGKGKMMLLLNGAAQMFFMGIRKRRDCTLLSIWQKPCIWKSLVWALWAAWRGCEGERVAFVINTDICRA